MKNSILTVLFAALLFLAPLSVPRALAAAPVGGAGGGGSGSAQATSSSGGVNIGAAVAGTALCVVMSAVFDPNVTDIGQAARYSVVPCVVITGVAIALGGPAGVVIAIFVGAVVRCIVGDSCFADFWQALTTPATEVQQIAWAREIEESR